MKRYLAAVAIVLSLFSGGVSASVISSVTQFTFSGVCTDCNQNESLPGFGQPATAQLFLKNYTLGEQISLGNFSSFHYDGTDLFTAFTVNTTDVTYIDGSMSSASGFENFRLYSNNYFFNSYSTGSWFVGDIGSIDDFGTQGTFTTSDASSVPEPAPLALFGIGLLGFIASRRKAAK